LEADIAARLEDAARELKESQDAHARSHAQELKECQDELAQARSMQARATADSLEVQRQRDELREELIRRTQEAHQMHRDLRHYRADVVVKEAFISDLRQQLREIEPLVSQRDQLLAKRDHLVAEHKRLSAKCKHLLARRDRLVEERRTLLVRLADSETTLRGLRTYANSAGFRIVEGVVARLRSFPIVFKPARAIARKIVKTR